VEGERFLDCLVRPWSDKVSSKDCGHRMLTGQGSAGIATPPAVTNIPLSEIDRMTEGEAVLADERSGIMERNVNALSNAERFYGSYSCDSRGVISTCFLKVSKDSA